MNTNVKKYYKYNNRELLDFRYRLYLLGKEKDLNKRVQIAQNLIYKACVCGIGVYSCPELEKPFLDLANTIPLEVVDIYQTKSFIHVMTQAYSTGGHTRVVERWIETAPKNERHSIILLDQCDVEYPNKLRDITSNHHGDLIILTEKDLTCRASKLRNIASCYEYVILHIHMYDPTALVAFGSDKFTRPVILFNHADHSYWCGASIVDMLADLRDNNFAFKRRGIKNRFTIRIPFETNAIFQNYNKSKEQSRRCLGIPLEKKVILTVGSAHKFQPFAGFEFCEIISQVISDMEDVVCYAIGPTSDIGGWGRYGDKFKALGPIEYGSIYYDYLNASDLYVDSIPIGGGTALLDAVQFHKPVLSYSPFIHELGDIIKGVETTNNKDIFIKRLRLVLSDDMNSNDIAINQYNTIMEYHGVSMWRKNVELMLEQTPSKHQIHNLENIQYKIDDTAVMISLWNKTSLKRKWSLYDIYHQVHRLLYICFKFVLKIYNT